VKKRSLTASYQSKWKLKEKETTGKLRYEHDSKQYNRFNVETESGIGNIYILKVAEEIPQRLILEYAGKTT